MQRVLTVMPVQVADPIYHALQEWKRAIPTDVPGQQSFLAEVASFMADIRGRTLAGLRVVEVGSGWFPVLPLLLVRGFGACTVQTFDVNRHYSSARIAAAAAAIMENIDGLRRDSVLRKTAASGRLPDSIRYYPRTNIERVHDVPRGKADLAVSRSVLEYIPPESIRRILAYSSRWLTQEALWIHSVGTSDDRARDDPTLNRFDFLKYSESAWARISGNRYGYNNRLRLPQYRALFESAGWKVERELASVSDTDLAKLAAIPVHPDFRGFSRRDLVAGGIRFALSRAKSQI